MQELLSIVLANLPAAILLIAGIVLVGVEVFIPGFGFPGITGIICLVLGVIFGAKTAGQAVALIVCIIVILCLVLFIAMRSAARGRLSRTPLVLNDSTSEEAGFNSIDNYEGLLNKEGIAVSMLRPSGIAEINDERYDVVTEAEFVKSGEPIRVIAVEGRRIVVRPVAEIDRQTQSS